MKFEDKVRSMTGKQILQSMIDGLKKEHVKVDMDFYGLAGDSGICYGCAATNAICEISGIVTRLNTLLIESLEGRSKIFNSDFHFIDSFESAIDCLRKGDVYEYNRLALHYDFAALPINKPIPNLPILSNDNYKDDLHYYQSYCDSI